LATVITNLLSAIPIFGQDIVELIYYFVKELSFIFGNEDFIYNQSVVALQSGGKHSVLPTIGIVSPQALKKGYFVQLRLDKNEYLSIPYQFISFLVGLIDGDGYIQITKTTKGFIAIKLVIGLGLDDLSTLEYIHSVLKLGKITIYRDLKNPNCKLIINKTDLQEVVFPLLIHHNIFFLTNTRRNQFDLAMHIFKTNIKYFENIPNINEISSIFKFSESASNYLNLKFFKNWVVGFTNAEGSFLMKSNKDGCFAIQLKQRTHIQLFEAFKLLFNTYRNLGIEKDRFVQFSVSSKSDIQKVIDFFSFSGLHPLIGIKNIQYFIWLTNLQNSDRYKNLNFPK
jgi:LAGLIDADG endonuclease